MSGYVKDKVLETKSRDIDDLRTRILHDIQSTPQQALQRFVSHVYATQAN